MKITRGQKNKLYFLVIIFSFIFFGTNDSIASDSNAIFVENSRETIKSASEYDYPPFSIVGENGEAAGFSAELLRAVVEDQGMDVDFYTGPWSEIKEDLANGEIDVLPLVGRTPEREAFYDFTVPYMTIYGGVFVKNQNIDIRNKDDLYDRKILVMEGDNAEEYIRRNNYSDNIITTRTFEEAFLLLSEEDYDLIIVNEMVGAQLIEKLEINNVKLAFKLNDFKQDWSFAVKKGDLELLAKLNNGLSRVISDGTFDLIRSKWIPSEDEIISADSGILWSGQELALRADFIAKKVEIILDNYIESTNLLYQFSNLKELLVQVNEEGVIVDNEFEKKFYPADREKYWDGIQEYFKDFYENNSDVIESVRLFHKNGYIVNGVLFGEEDTNDYEFDLNWFQDLIDPEKTKDGEVYVSNINIPLLSDTKTIRFAVPIDNNGERLGFLIINYLADEVFSFIDNQKNVMLVDKEFQDIKGNVIGDWAVTIKDSRNTKATLDTSERTASIKNSELLKGHNGFIDFFDRELLKTGAYQKIKIPEKEWYIITFNDLIADEDIGEKNTLPLKINKYEIYIVFFVIFSFLLLIVILLLTYFKIIKIERRVLFAISVIVYLSICAIFSFFTSLSVGELKNHFKDDLVNRNHHTEKTIYSSLDSIFNIMKKDLEYASEKFQSLNCSEDQGCLDVLIDFFDESDSLVYSASRTSREGFILSTYPEDDHVGSYIGNQDHMIKVKNEKKPILSQVFKAVEGFMAVSIHYPVIKGDEYDGTVSFLLNIEKPFEFLLSNDFSASKIFILDSFGNVISSTEKDNAGESLFDKEKYTPIADIIKKPSDELESDFKEFYYQGENMIISYTPVFIMGNTWYVVTESNEKDAYHSLKKTLDNIWIFTFVVLGVLAVFAYFFNWFLTKTLRKEVDSRTKELKRKTDLIGDQLKKEELNNKEKETLIKKQKKIEKNLENKILEMEKFQKLVVDRELKMVELKKELSELKKNSKGKIKK